MELETLKGVEITEDDLDIEGTCKLLKDLTHELKGVEITEDDLDIKGTYKLLKDLAHEMDSLSPDFFCDETVENVVKTSRALAARNKLLDAKERYYGENPESKA
jgi:hypothetical protein